MKDRIGQYLGNYQLVKLLGRGGCSEVYLGKHRYLNSYAALKVLHARIQPGNEQKILAEAQTLVDLRHSNIVHLLDFVLENSTPVLIMDYAPKGSLRQQYPPGTQMSLTTVVDFVTQIATALQYAHNHHIIHRDVKPENILLDADSRLLLSDFGLSLLAPSLEELSTQDPAGTPRYMAPEQLRGKPCFASDQYALAVMVYEWLCGELPFHGQMWELWQNHLFTAPPPLRTTRPDIPPQLEAIVLRALAKKPQDRFVSIQAFARALAQSSQIATPVERTDILATDRLQPVPHSPLLETPHHTLSSHRDQIAQLPTRGLTELPPATPRVSTLQERNRVRMLGRLRRSYNDLMSQSLQGAAWLELGLASKPGAIQNAANLFLHLPHRTEQLLPTGVSIVQAYDEAGHELLILGEPGAGKSTLLLDLAQQLLVRAERDQTHPLPVILPLSSWATKHPKLADWIAEQMSEIYDVPRKLSVQWVQGDSILPLLDGLDEMEEDARAACIIAINTYHREQMAQLVICSRTTEYEAAASHHRLALQGAVVIQPLAHEDVDAYLIQAGQWPGQASSLKGGDRSPPYLLAGLRSALEKNKTLYDLATTPLMLNILILTYQGTSVGNLAHTESLLLQQVWEDYVQRMVARKGNSKRYPLSKTQAWLSWLARQMREHNQTVFYLEHLQPDWLEAKEQRTYARLAVRLPAIFIGVLVSILVQLFFFGHTKIADLSSYIAYAILGVLLGGLWRGPVPETGSWGEHRHMWGIRLVKRLAISVCFGVIGGLGLGFYMQSHFHYTLSQWQTNALAYGLVRALSILLLQYLLTVPFHPGWSFENRVPQRWKGAVRFWSAVQGPRALLVAFILGLSDLLSVWLVSGLAGWLTVVLNIGLIYGLISLGLSAQMEDIRPTERLRWTWRSLRRGLFNPKHLRIAVLITCISAIFVGLGYGPRSGLSVGLSCGLSYWCLLGLFQGIAQEQIENQDRRIANQGMRRSLHNSLMMGLIGGVMFGIIGVLHYWFIVNLNKVLGYAPQVPLISGLRSVVSYGLFLTISGALLIFLLTGGVAVLRHYVMRLLLWRSHTFPGAASQFLDDASARFLLRRVGGGYSFAHRLLQDHFVAACEPDG